jgi:regulator of protease activity HflC (stomatin/prohibitin superfamily)
LTLAIIGADIDYENPDGTRTAVWPAGLHPFYPPWFGVSQLVTKQSVVLDLPVKACKTKDNVTVNVDVSLVFRIMGDADLGEDPELVRKFVYQVKPRGLEQQLRDAQEEAVRALARSMRHTEIYGIRSGQRAKSTPTTPAKDGTLMYDSSVASEADSDSSERSDNVFVGSSDQHDRKLAEKSIMKGERVAAEMRDRLNQQFIPQGVEVQSVMIKSISLPSDIEGQMTEKTMIISANAQQRMYHVNEMQNTRMEQEVQTMLQRFDEVRQEELASGTETMNSEQVKLNDAKSQAVKSEKNIREETTVKLNSIEADNSLEVQRINDRMYETATKIRADAEREAAELVATTKVETQTVLADSHLQSTLNKTQAQKIISNAEGKIAPMLAKKKEYETRLREVQVYENLADNPHLIISGSSNEDVNLLAVADSILHADTNHSRSAVLAELALLNQGSASFMKKTDAVVKA